MHSTSMSKNRVCVIGNSHIAALRSGLDLMPELGTEFIVDFFAAQSDLMREMELQGTRLTPTSELTKNRMSVISGGKTQIETSDYTDFLIVGLGFNFLQAINTLRKYQLYGFQDGVEKNLPYLSRACLTALIEFSLRESTAMYFARLLRRVSKARIVVIPQPYPSEIVKQISCGRFWTYASDSGLLTFVCGLYKKCAKQVITSVDCEIIFQPSGTLAQEGITHAKYSIGSVRLGADKNHRHPLGEAFHMNAVFGTEVLKVYRELLLS